MNTIFTILVIIGFIEMAAVAFFMMFIAKIYWWVFWPLFIAFLWVTFLVIKRGLAMRKFKGSDEEDKQISGQFINFIVKVYLPITILFFIWLFIKPEAFMKKQEPQPPAAVIMINKNIL